jgi:Tfp pilus assembly protein PilF
LARGQLDQAVGCYQQALQIKPDYFEARANLGNGLASQGHWQAAIDQYQQALSTQPHPQILCNLANALLAQDRGQQAVESYQQALALTPNSAELHNNLGNALRTLNRWDAALFHYQEAIRLQPQDPQPYHNLGNTLQEQQQIPAALHWYEKALHLKPDAAETHLNLAQALLSLGDFERGLEHYEWRLLCRASSPRSLTQPRWDGSPLQGRTVLVYAEQGLGDTIQFIRYAQHLAQQGERVVVECPASLTRLLQTGSGLQAVVATGSALPPFDLHAPLLSLPLLCGTRLDSIPAACPYLQAPEHPIPLPMPTSADPTKVGIVWAGGHYRTSLSARRAYQLKSCPVERMMDLLQLPGLHLISLQVGEDAEALQPYLAHERIWDLSAQLQDFADTASVIAQLDLVISVDTAVAHLAGALGKPVWVLLPFAADWRWLLDRADSPWYPTMRLFRQTHPGDWRGVLTQVSQALASGI